MAIVDVELSLIQARALARNELSLVVLATSEAPDPVAGMVYVLEPWAVAAEFDRFSPSHLPRRAFATICYQADDPGPDPNRGRWREARYLPPQGKRYALHVQQRERLRLARLKEDDARRAGYQGAAGPDSEYHILTRLGVFRVEWTGRHRSGEQWKDNPEVVLLTVTREVDWMVE